jgi:hypothetical protein
MAREKESATTNQYLVPSKKELLSTNVECSQLVLQLVPTSSYSSLKCRVLFLSVIVLKVILFIQVREYQWQSRLELVARYVCWIVALVISPSNVASAVMSASSGDERNGCCRCSNSSTTTSTTGRVGVTETCTN